MGASLAMELRPTYDGRRWRNGTSYPRPLVNQRVRKQVEEVFGWLKTVGGGRKLRYSGVARNGLRAEMALAEYSLVRMAKLMPSPWSPEWFLSFEMESPNRSRWRA